MSTTYTYKQAANAMMHLQGTLSETCLTADTRLSFQAQQGGESTEQN